MPRKKSLRKSLKKMLKKSLEKSLRKSGKHCHKKSLKKYKRKTRKPSVKKTKKTNKLSKRTSPCKYGEHTNGNCIKKRHNEIGNLIDNKTLIKYIKKSIHKSRKPTLLKNNVKTPKKLTQHRFQITDDKKTDDKKDGERFSIFTSIFNDLKGIIGSIRGSLSFVSESSKFKNNLTYLVNNKTNFGGIVSKETIKSLENLYNDVMGVPIILEDVNKITINPTKKPQIDIIKDILNPDTQFKIKKILGDITIDLKNSKADTKLKEKIKEIIIFIDNRLLTLLYY